MISLISKANEAGLNIYAYMYLEILYKQGEISELVSNFNLLEIKGGSAADTIVLPLVQGKYIIVDQIGNVNITPRGKSLFLNENDKYLEVMKHYPLSLYLSGASYPAKVNDSKCIEVLSKVDLNETSLEDIIKSIKYAKKHDLIKMKFDKYIESKFYEAVIEKMTDDTPINFGIYGKSFGG